MKTLGIIGGMSWESSVLYYQWINRGIKERLGGLHSARLMLNSVDFAEIETLQHAGDWDGAGLILNKAARALEVAGCDLLLIATNTMHKVAQQTLVDVELPLVHIVDPTAQAIKAKGLNRVGLLGTGFTMSDDFYRGRMTNTFDIDVIIPEADEQSDVHHIIYEELCLGTVNADSKARYLEIVQALASRGAEAVIMGCTEITLLIGQEDTVVPLFDTTAIHASAAVDAMLE